MPDVGLSFSPTSSPGQYGTAQNGRGASSPVMDAIKILSFRVPQVLGQNAPVAPGLLAGGTAGGGASPSGVDNSALMMQWLQRFFGQGLAQNPELLGQLTGAGGPPRGTSTPTISLANGPGQPYTMLPVPQAPQQQASFVNTAPPSPNLQRQVDPIHTVGDFGPPMPAVETKTF